MAGWFLELEPMHGKCHLGPASGRFTMLNTLFVDNRLETKQAPTLILMPRLTLHHLAEIGKFLLMPQNRHRNYFGTPGCICSGSC